MTIDHYPSSLRFGYLRFQNLEPWFCPDVFPSPLASLHYLMYVPFRVWVNPTVWILLLHFDEFKYVGPLCSAVGHSGLDKKWTVYFHPISIHLTKETTVFAAITIKADEGTGNNLC